MHSPTASAPHRRPEGEIAAALVVGVRAGIPEDVNEALRRTGLAHVLSISGLHMALVAATIMGVLRVGFAFFPDFASRRPVKKIRGQRGAWSPSPLYLFISGIAVAAERSFIMLAVMLIAVLFDRAALTMRNLAISAIVIIARVAARGRRAELPDVVRRDRRADRRLCRLVGAPARAPTAPPSERPRGRRTAARARRHAVGLALTSLIAGTATAIFGAYHFQRVSPLSLAANLAAMPFVSVMVMPFAMFAMILMPFGLDGWAFAVMGKGLSAMIAVADWFSELSPIDAVGLVPAGAVVAVRRSRWCWRLFADHLAASPLPLPWPRWPGCVAARRCPTSLVSEDGRLVGLRPATARSPSAARGRTLSPLEDWQRALAGRDASSSPRKPGDRPDLRADDASARPNRLASGFACADGLCLGTHRRRRSSPTPNRRRRNVAALAPAPR